MHPYFNSRPPSRSVSRHLHFNSRTHKEVDPTAARIFCNSYLNFNSRPREEVDSLISSLLLRYISISTHDLARRSTAIKSCPVISCVFQLTTSQGGRHNIILLDSAGNSFQLTTSRGGRPLRNAPKWGAGHISTHDLTRRSTAATSLSVNGYIFQLTTSRGGRQGTKRERKPQRAFQLTTSRGGRRLRRAPNICPERISTHDLARRSTQQTLDAAIMDIISTHDLARRSTKILLGGCLCSQFQLTTSQGGRL